MFLEWENVGVFFRDCEGREGGVGSWADPHCVPCGSCFVFGRAAAEPRDSVASPPAAGQSGPGLLAVWEEVWEFERGYNVSTPLIPYLTSHISYFILFHSHLEEDTKGD